MKILFQFSKNTEHPLITIDGVKYQVINKLSGELTGLRDTMISVDRYIEYEVEPINERCDYCGDDDYGIVGSYE